MPSLRRISIFFIIVLLHLSLSLANIHRAKQSRISRKTRDDGFFVKYFSKTKTAWFYSIPAALLVGCTGILPLLIIPVQAGQSLKEGVSPKNLKVLLSFAVGGLLGDVFLHLLPEAWMYTQQNGHDHWAGISIGLWVIVGLLTFLILEKIFSDEQNDKEGDNSEEHVCEKEGISSGKSEETEVFGKDHTVLANGKPKNGYHLPAEKNGIVFHNDENRNGIRKRESSSKNDKNDPIEDKKPEDSKSSSQPIKVVGYLNLMANCIDNFTHGLAVAGSFIVSPKVGMCTTIAILLHEIPHEVGDFAILLKSGFNRWDAAVGQMVTAMGGLVGAIFGLVAEGAGDSSAWVLPFTSGGFIYIAMVTVVPDLLKETSLRESVKQTLALLAGIGAMALVTTFHH